MLNNFFGKSVFSGETAKTVLGNLKKINSWNALETSYSSLMLCLKYNVSFLSNPDTIKITNIQPGFRMTPV